MLDGRVLGAPQVEYRPFGKPPLKREVLCSVFALSRGAASELHAELHTGSNQKMVGACFQPRLTRQPAESYGSYGSYGHTAAWRCAALPRLPGIEASSLPSPRQGWDSSTEVGIPTSPSKERDTGNAGIPCRNPALNSPQILIQRASTQVAPVQHKCHLCYLCSHSCRARRKSRSGTRSRACPKKSDMPRFKFHAKKLTSRTEVPKRNSQWGLSAENRPAPLQIARQRGGFDT